VVPEAAAPQWGGKSGLHRAGSCRKAGRGNPAEQGHREQTACPDKPQVGWISRRFIRAGKGETVG